MTLAIHNIETVSVEHSGEMDYARIKFELAYGDPPAIFDLFPRTSKQYEILRRLQVIPHYTEYVPKCLWPETVAEKEFREVAESIEAYAAKDVDDDFPF